jgi:hypothetical protein
VGRHRERRHHLLHLPALNVTPPFATPEASPTTRSSLRSPDLFLESFSYLSALHYRPLSFPLSRFLSRDLSFESLLCLPFCLPCTAARCSFRLSHSVITRPFLESFLCLPFCPPCTAARCSFRLSHSVITRPFLESFLCLPYVAARLMSCLSHSVESSHLLSHLVCCGLCQLAGEL